VAILHPVVLPLANFVAVEIVQFVHRGRIGTQSVGNNHLSRAVPLQGFPQKLQSCCFIAFPRHERFEDFRLVINRTPQIMALAIDPDEDFIEVPAPLAKPPHPIHPLPSDISREQLLEAVPPQPHRLVADIDTPLEQQILDVAQRQRGPPGHHHHQPNHFG